MVTWWINAHIDSHSTFISSLHGRCLSVIKTRTEKIYCNISPETCSDLLSIHAPSPPLQPNPAVHNLSPAHFLLCNSIARPNRHSLTEREAELLSRHTLGIRVLSSPWRRMTHWTMNKCPFGDRKTFAFWTRWPKTWGYLTSVKGLLDHWSFILRKKRYIYNFWNCFISYIKEVLHLLDKV